MDFSKTKLWHWVAKNVLAKVTFRVWPKPWPSEIDIALLHHLVAANKSDDHMMCFVAQDRFSLGSILIRIVSKSTWSHAGFIFAGSRVDVQTDGLKVMPIGTLLRYDRLAIVQISVEDKNKAREKLLAYITKKNDIKYDWSKELSDPESPIETNDIYCSELVWLCLKNNAQLQCSEVLGRKVFSPEDVAKSGRIIWRLK